MRIGLSVFAAVSRRFRFGDLVVHHADPPAGTITLSGCWIDGTALALPSGKLLVPDVVVVAAPPESGRTKP